jgi:hypothetical protein
MQHGSTRRSGERAMFLTALGLAAWWVVVLAPDAEAYIDPSAGGMLVQLVLAGTAGVAILGKLFWLRIKRLFGMAEPEGSASSTASGPDQPHDHV